MIAPIKVWFSRASSYLAIANMGMILYLFLQSSKLPYTIWVMFPIALIGIIVVGYFDEKFGIHKAEQSYNNRQNPQLQEIIARLDRIEKNQ